jgi:hypothetical protein
MIAHPTDTSETIPCTLCMSFYIHSNTMALESTVTLRSSDAVWGLPYDMIQYGMVHLAVASCIGILPGNVNVNMVNAHVYVDHDGGPVWNLEMFSMPEYKSWDQYVDWANTIIDFLPNRRDLEKTFFLREYEHEMQSGD